MASDKIYIVFTLASTFCLIVLYNNNSVYSATTPTVASIGNLPNLADETFILQKSSVPDTLEEDIHHTEACQLENDKDSCYICCRNIGYNGFEYDNDINQCPCSTYFDLEEYKQKTHTYEDEEEFYDAPENFSDDSNEFSYDPEEFFDTLTEFSDD